jgi:hypothetical protein
LLAALSAFVEGPLLALAASKFRADLGKATLRTAEQRDRVDAKPHCGIRSPLSDCSTRPACLFAGSTPTWKPE